MPIPDLHFKKLKVFHHSRFVHLRLCSNPYFIGAYFKCLLRSSFPWRLYRKQTKNHRDTNRRSSNVHYQHFPLFLKHRIVTSDLAFSIHFYLKTEGTKIDDYFSIFLHISLSFHFETLLSPTISLFSLRLLLQNTPGTKQQHN